MGHTVTIIALASEIHKLSPRVSVGIIYIMTGQFPQTPLGSIHFVSKSIVFGADVRHVDMVGRGIS